MLISSFALPCFIFMIIGMFYFGKPKLKKQKYDVTAKAPRHTGLREVRAPPLGNAGSYFQTSTLYESVKKIHFILI